MKYMNKIVNFLKEKDDIELFVVGSLLSTIAAFYIYCVWSLVT